jgi:hypothetical protein
VASDIIGHSADIDLQLKSRAGRGFDHRLNTSKRLGVLAGVDFLASPLDVKPDGRTVNVIPQNAYIFLTPHVRAKFDLRCAMLHLWAEGGPLDTFYAKDGGPLGIGRQWAQVKGQAMKGGHSFAEENPDDTAFLLERSFRLKPLVMRRPNLPPKHSIGMNWTNVSQVLSI